jgi:Flp pilus assembly protein TadB
MARTATIRASDADRDSVAERLRAAAVEGRIDADELEQRLHLALRARTYGDLRRLVADLPAGRPERSPGAAALSLAVRAAVLLVALAVIVTVLLVTALWWIAGTLLWLTLRGRRYGWARPRSKALPTSIGFLTMPNSRSQAAHFCSTSPRSCP